jgi:hypothetical protein
MPVDAPSQRTADGEVESPWEFEGRIRSDSPGAVSDFVVAAGHIAAFREMGLRLLRGAKVQPTLRLSALLVR